MSYRFISGLLVGAFDPGYGFNEMSLFVFVNADAVFLILYKELYYRHIYAKVSVSTLGFTLLCFNLKNKDNLSHNVFVILFI